MSIFTDGKKIDDPMLIAKMTNSEPFLLMSCNFNIDSKGSAKGWIRERSHRGSFYEGIQ